MTHKIIIVAFPIIKPWTVLMVTNVLFSCIVVQYLVWNVKKNFFKKWNISWNIWNIWNAKKHVLYISTCISLCLSVCMCSTSTALHNSLCLAYFLSHPLLWCCLLCIRKGMQPVKCSATAVFIVAQHDSTVAACCLRLSISQQRCHCYCNSEDAAL